MFSPTEPVYICHARAKGLLDGVMNLLAIRLGCPKTAAESLVMLLGVVLLFFTALVVTLPAWAAGENRIAVIYHDIGEPYRGIFEKIIDGIEDKAGTPIAKYPVQYDTDIGALKSSLRRQNTKVVIALGRQGMKTAAALDRNIWFVVGGVLTVPESEARMQPVISLSGSGTIVCPPEGADAVGKACVCRLRPWLQRLADEAGQRSRSYSGAGVGGA